MLDLSDVTICAVASVNVALSARALELSIERCGFCDVILFTDTEISGPFRTVKIDTLTRHGYQIFRFSELAKLVDSPFVLSIEWDGYVLDPRAWHPSFREYDYIGAKWPSGFLGVRDGMNVGNSGFCLQSKKALMRSLIHVSRRRSRMNSSIFWFAVRTVRRWKGVTVYALPLIRSPTFSRTRTCCRCSRHSGFMALRTCGVMSMTRACYISPINLIPVSSAANTSSGCWLPTACNASSPSSNNFTPR
jgi:hypothetical protein